MYLWHDHEKMDIISNLRKHYFQSQWNFLDQPLIKTLNLMSISLVFNISQQKLTYSKKISPLQTNKTIVQLSPIWVIQVLIGCTNKKSIGV